MKLTKIDNNKSGSKNVSTIFAVPILNDEFDGN